MLTLSRWMIVFLNIDALPLPTPVVAVIASNFFLLEFARQRSVIMHCNPAAALLRSAGELVKPGSLGGSSRVLSQQHIHLYDYFIAYPCYFWKMEMQQ